MNGGRYVGVDVYVVRNRLGEAFYATTDHERADALVEQAAEYRIERQRHVLKVV